MKGPVGGLADVDGPVHIFVVSRVGPIPFLDHSKSIIVGPFERGINSPAEFQVADPPQECNVPVGVPAEEQWVLAGLGGVHRHIFNDCPIQKGAEGVRVLKCDVPDSRALLRIGPGPVWHEPRPAVERASLQPEVADDLPLVGKSLLEDSIPNHAHNRPPSQSGAMPSATRREKPMWPSRSDPRLGCATLGPWPTERATDESSCDEQCAHLDPLGAIVVHQRPGCAHLLDGIWYPA